MRPFSNVKSLPRPQSTPKCLLSYHLQRALHDYFEEFALPDCVGYSNNVVETLKKRIENKECVSLEGVAHDLEVSAKTLNRRLVQEGYTYQHLFDQVRRHFSFHLLMNNVSIADICQRLDFDSDEQFNSSFIRWTGLEPNAFLRLFCSERHLVTK